MALDQGYCSGAEFNYWHGERLQELDVELEVDEVYQLMCLLVGQHPGQEAAKTPALITDAPVNKASCYVVEFTVAAFKPNPAYETEGTFDQGGNWHPGSSKLWIGQVGVKAAFFKDYDGNAETADSRRDELRRATRHSRRRSRTLVNRFW
jgi:hypothetical protein